MKHKFSIITAALAAALCLVPGLAGCKPSETETPHEHVFGDWIQGPETHWRECEVCHEKFVEATHTFRNVVGQSYSMFSGENSVRPVLFLSAENSKKEYYIKEVWVCMESESGTLRIACSSSEGGTFARNVDLSVEKGWQKATFSEDGERLALSSYIRLEAIGSPLTINEIVFLAGDAEGKEELVLLNAEVVSASGQEWSRQKALIDAQQFPNEKRECYVCHYPEPKAEK